MHCIWVKVYYDAEKCFKRQNTDVETRASISSYMQINNNKTHTQKKQLISLMEEKSKIVTSASKIHWSFSLPLPQKLTSHKYVKNLKKGCKEST